MKIKDLLELCKDKCCCIEIFDIYSYEKKEYKYVQDAIRDYGFFPIVFWYLELGGLKIETKTQF